ncbi:MAG: hypothetical protein ACYCWN_12920 [Ferrimicrobium sp.]|jgi:hypothetical protein|uniref:Uncharacterized protein n=1 Tax=Ferrimicrobium acidiphilum TaxID=121039 RepID=A0ABV3Y5E2_9ACTN|nr:hypothetical protein [Ferrimicrobium sp.]
MDQGSTSSVPYWRRSGEERFERRQANRGKWVKRGMLAFGAVLVLSIPIELHQFDTSEALAAKEVILRANELQLGNQPFVDYGPNGRAAGRQFGTGSWITPAAKRLCNTVQTWTGSVAHIKVGFLEARGGATGILAASCDTTGGYPRLVIGRYGPPGALVKIVLSASQNVTLATVVATPSTLYLKDPVYGDASVPAKVSKVVIEKL